MGLFFQAILGHGEGRGSGGDQTMPGQDFQASRGHVLEFGGDRLAQATHADQGHGIAIIRLEVDVGQRPRG